MDKEYYYIRGSKENPEGVRKALMEKYPNAKLDGYPTCFFESNILSVNEGKGTLMSYHEDDLPAGLLLKYGTELKPPIKEKKLVKHEGWQVVYKRLTEDNIYSGIEIFETQDKAMDLLERDEDAIGIAPITWLSYE